MNSRNFLRCIKRIAPYQGGSDWKQTHSQLYMHPEKLDTLQPVKNQCESAKLGRHKKNQHTNKDYGYDNYYSLVIQLAISSPRHDPNP